MKECMADKKSGAGWKEKLNFVQREDRLGRYLKPLLKSFVFGEFSDEFLDRSPLPADLQKTMKGVPIPLRQGDLALFAGRKGLGPDVICENMIWVMGCDPTFIHVPAYQAYLGAMFDCNLTDAMVEVAQKDLEKEEYEKACLHVRAALVMEPESLSAMYAYAMVTRAMYQSQAGQDSEYVGRCKAESMEYFELLTYAHPDFAQSYYFLGYAYLNMGLYQKAGLAWADFMQKSGGTATQTDLPKGESESGQEPAPPEQSTNRQESDAADAVQGAVGLLEEERKEIAQRLVELRDPIIIEEGVAHAAAGRFDSAILILEPYVRGRFEKWWPLHYYLGISYKETGNLPEAILAFKRVLKTNASHLESMEALAALYAQIGDEQMAEKYEHKLQIVKEALSQEGVLH